MSIIKIGIFTTLLDKNKNIIAREWIIKDKFMKKLIKYKRSYLEDC